MDDSHIIDEIYESAIVPDLWTRTLDRLTHITGGEGAVLFADVRQGCQSIHSPSLGEFVRLWISGRWGERNERAKRQIPLREPRFLRDLDVFTAEELDEIPLYRDLLKPLGLGWCTGTAIRTPSNDTIICSIERHLKNGPVEPEAIRRLDGLRSHLARAAVLTARTGFERARTTVLALEAVDLPAAVLSSSLRVIAANRPLIDYSPAIRIGAGDVLTLENSAAQAKLSGATRWSEMAPCSFPLPGNEVN